jgi:hypothetical protein
VQSFGVTRSNADHTAACKASKVRAGGADRRDHRGGLPVAVRNFLDHPHAARRSAAGAGHVGLRGGFIDEHELLDRHVLQMFMPEPACGLDVGPVLLGGVKGLFLKPDPAS